MSDVDFTTITRPITRDQIAAAVGNNPRAIRVIEHLVEDISGTLPGYLAQMQTELRVAQSRVEALEEALQRGLEAGDVSRAAHMAAVVEQVREQVREESGVTVLSAQVDQLRELITAGGGMKIKRVIHDSIVIQVGDTEADYTISPALASLDKALLVFNGSWGVAGAPNGGAMILSATNNINYRFGLAVTNQLYGRFTLMEFE